MKDLVIFMKKSTFAKLYTKEGKELTASALPHNIYPRPQMVRDSFFCLNGVWDFGHGKNECYGKEITVPFPPQSLLSGIGYDIDQKETLFYRRRFSLPAEFSCDDSRIILHIGAADQCTKVYLNGSLLGEHKGGYDPFSFDITDSLEKENELKLHIKDELDKKILPYGKQRKKRGGMWYTPFSGIWQTVWIEAVPKDHIKEISIDCNTSNAKITVSVCGNDEGAVLIFEEKEYPFVNKSVTISPKNKRLWSPEDPYLYSFKIRLGKDEISSYFALRSIYADVCNGIPRLMLNGRPYFLHAVLDQGYFSDGLSTPADPICFENDIMLMKSMGVNTLRKHIKAEPEQFYYDCDRLGMIVMQDMINNGSYSFIRDTALPTIGMKRMNDTFLHRSSAARKAFIDCSLEIINRLKNHPSVCYFTIFNEGWGQFCGKAIYKMIKNLVPNHIVDTASGWFECKESDVVSPHVYFKPFKFKKAEKPVVLSEFGGYSLSVPGHSFNKEKTYGYKIFHSSEKLEKALSELYENEIIPAVSKGLCGAVLTQLSDVEDETNGLVTYDRAVNKISQKAMKHLSKKIYNELEF